MPTMNEAFPSKYVAGEDFTNGDQIVRITSYKQETMKGNAGDELRWVLYFEGHTKGLVLNKTNGRAIATLYGDSFDGWIGKQITLGGQWADAFGENKFVVRVRPQMIQQNGGAATQSAVSPDTAPETATPGDLDSDIPF